MIIEFCKVQKRVFLLLVISSLGISCSSRSKVVKAPPAPPVTAEVATANTPVAISAVASTPATSNSEVIPPVQAKIEPVHLEPSKQALEDIQLHLVKKSTPHHDEEGVDPDKSLGWLKNGNLRYTKGRLRDDGQSSKDRKRLTSGQKPHAIVLSCSDSRVPPEVVFDQKLGEIFVIRTAGEALDPMALASIEYALEHLGTRLIVVMGHTSCGAVTAALKTPVGGDAGSENLNKLVADIQPRIQSFLGKSLTSEIESESWANTKGVAHDLMERSKIISERVKSGDVKIVSSLYYMDSGKVSFQD